MRCLVLGGIVLASVCTSEAQSPSATQRAVVNKYCVTCHNERLRTAGLTLEKADMADVGSDAALWEKVLSKLRTAAMPPAGVPRPDPSAYSALTNYVETALDHAAESKLQPGRVSVHRLNRAEYINAVRDLLGVDVNVEALLPADDSGYGFDNIADVLSVSPMLLQRYLSAARKVSRIAVGDPNIPTDAQIYDLPPLLMQDHRMSEDLPFGSRGGTAIRHNFPLDGEYIVKIRLQRSGAFHDQDIIGISEPRQLEVRLDGERLKLFTIGGVYPPSIPGVRKVGEEAAYYRTADSILELRFPAKAGSRLVAVDFPDETVAPEGGLQSRAAAFRFLNKRTEDIPPNVARVTIEGPYQAQGADDTVSRRKIFVCQPTGSADELACAKKILSGLARRAYRRPVTDADVQALLGLYQKARQESNFEAGITRALQGMLVYPEFLFRIESDPANLAAGAPYKISDLELASRLSFFLWSSIPDDTLLDVAARGQLKDPAMLEQQARRMLADSRSKALVRNFAGQWLYLRNMRTVGPDPQIFPEFDENLREGFARETELFIEDNLREDRSVVNLLNANYTFVNERLARFYGIPNIYGSNFRRVTLSSDERKGLLGQGSILTVTSYANRTSPTIRGKWLLENFLGTPPPPPPPNVPSLKEQSGQSGAILTMRHRMEAHLANPACAVCHTRMDPLGFALENFDAIGQWRTAEGRTPINTSGVLPDGTKFNGPVELRNILLSHPEQFANTVTQKMLTYALGRGVEYYDLPSVRKIMRGAAPDYKWSSLIVGIVKSVPFQMSTVKTAVSQNLAKGESKP
jgi:cytochrome c5